MREMRRKKQALDEETCAHVLKTGQYGTLALLGDDDYPYALPINFYYEAGHIYFHGALQGHKLDAITKHQKASFLVVSHPYKEEGQWWNQYKSVVCFGKITKLEEKDAKLKALIAIGQKYYPTKQEGETLARQTVDRVTILDFKVEEMSGKHINEK